MTESLPKKAALDKILCIRTERRVRNDFTISHEKRLYQVLDKVNAKKVLVEEKVDGTMLITYKGDSLRFKEIAMRPEKQYIQAVTPIIKKKNKYKPPANHPWRSSGHITQKIKFNQEN